MSGIASNNQILYLEKYKRAIEVFVSAQAALIPRYYRQKTNTPVTMPIEKKVISTIKNDWNLYAKSIIPAAIKSGKFTIYCDDYLPDMTGTKSNFRGGMFQAYQNHLRNVSPEIFNQHLIKATFDEFENVVCTFDAQRLTQYVYVICKFINRINEIVKGSNEYLQATKAAQSQRLNVYYANVLLECEKNASENSARLKRMINFWESTANLKSYSFTVIHHRSLLDLGELILQGIKDGIIKGIPNDIFGELPTDNYGEPEYSISAPQMDAATSADQHQFIKDVLFPLSGNWLNGTRIMTQQEHNRLIEYVTYLVDKRDIPKKIHRIGRTAATNDFIKHTFYLIYKHYGKLVEKELYLQFIKRVFDQFEGVEAATLNKKFSSFESNYESMVKDLGKIR